MTRARLLLLAGLLAGCGGLENEPLTRGVLEGTLARPDALALVAVMGRPDLAAQPDAEGRFRLVDVPSGEQDLLLVLDGQRAERRVVAVAGGTVTDLGIVEGRRSGLVLARLGGPDLLQLSAGEVSVVGTPLRAALSSQREARLVLGAGCYTLRATHPGLATVEEQVCVNEGEQQATELELPEPDGEPGHEGCRVTGCEGAASCRPDGYCEAP